MAMASVFADVLRDRVALEATNAVIRVEAREDRRYTILQRSSDGRFLACGSGSLSSDSATRAQEQLHCADTVDDSAVWRPTSDGYEHSPTGTVVAVAARSGRTVTLLLPRQTAGGPAGPRSSEAGPSTSASASSSVEPVTFTAEWGPESLPSEYLEAISTTGIVCMPTLLEPAVVAELREEAAKQAEAERIGEPIRTELALRSATAIKAAMHPVALYVIRAYMKTEGVDLAHWPGFATLPPHAGTGTRGFEGPGGWHSDWPYAPGILHNYLETHGSYPTEIPLGLQMNTCITPFTQENGGTCFVPSSRDLNRPPPPHWGHITRFPRNGDDPTGGWSYAGPLATQYEAPAGTVILYDARTWHRSGMNLSADDRVATLCSCKPAWMVPNSDQRNMYTELTQERPSIIGQLTARERRDVERMMSAGLSPDAARELMQTAIAEGLAARASRSTTRREPGTTLNSSQSAMTSSRL
jgi:ectoine hydroxylase-related dioxygenase (phytanoyl-CoA dioxygenase family)